MGQLPPGKLHSDGVELASMFCALAGAIALVLLLAAATAGLLGLVGVGAIAGALALIGAVIFGLVAQLLGLLVSRMKGVIYIADRRQALVGSAIGAVSSIVAIGGLVWIIWVG